MSVAFPAVSSGIFAVPPDVCASAYVAAVRQFWAEECRARPAAVVDELIAHLRSRDVPAVYFSNDIDGTDEAHADATGTPEPLGLSPEFLVSLIRALGKNFTLIGGDVMEVAPPVQRRRFCPLRKRNSILNPRCRRLAMRPNRTEQALEALRKARNLRTDLAKDFPTVPDFRHDLAVSFDPDLVTTHQHVVALNRAD